MKFSSQRDAIHRSTTACFLLLTAAFALAFYIFGNTNRLFRGSLSQNTAGVVGVSTLDVYIPPGRADDFYQIVEIVFDGQSIPLSIDSSTADTFIASDQCDNVNRESGCYRLQRSYHIDEDTSFILGEGFDTYLGKGRVVGNLSLASVQLNGVASPNATIALIDYAMRDEFQNGSFSGILGLGLRPASQQWLKHQRLPLIETLIGEKKLQSPVFSLVSPRYGDQDQSVGRLNLGSIDEGAPTDIAYAEVMSFSRNPEKLDNLETVAWSTSLQGIRINGAEVHVTPGRLRTDAQHVSVLDSGASYLYLRTPDFYTIIQHFEGPTITEKDPIGDKVYYECEQPQTLELKLHDSWYPLDPLDMLVPNSHFIVNGSEMCQASIRTWDMTTFGDSLLGLPFLRSVFAVFDYVSQDMYSVAPRLGLASMVDTRNSAERYREMYINRLR